LSRSGGDQAVQAAKAATATIPIVATIASDPVESGLVASLNRPGGNITGVSMFSTALVAKRVQLLHEIAPNVSVLGFLANPSDPSAKADAKSGKHIVGFLSAARRLHRSDSERRKARRSASVTANQVRSSNQPQDREGDRRRGDRVAAC
jgi:putative ABC transport system substrate-binding protein